MTTTPAAPAPFLSSAVRAGVPHVVFSSTAAVYGTVEAGHLVRETDPLTPQSPYGCSKLMSELILRDCAYAYGLNFVALRYFNVAAPIRSAAPASPRRISRISSRPPARRAWHPAPCQRVRHGLSDP